MKKLSKKMLALLLAVLMVFTIVPMGAFTAAADEAKDRYLFAYFTGNAKEEQRVKFALSEDGDNYYAINKNDPVLKQNLGTGCARDPYIFRGQDGKYYAIATDADCSTNIWWDNSNSFVIWRSDDLVTWSNETIINVAEIAGVSVHRAWAPQVIWDSAAQKYMVYFGLAADGYSAGGTKMHYMYTTDLLDQSKYEAPQPLMKNNTVSNSDSIDADITYYNGTYYMFFKDEGNATICIVTSNTINGPYDTDNIVPLAAGSDIGGLEGCQVWWNEDTEQYVFIADRYGSNGGKGGIFACYNIGANLDTFYNAVSANHDITGYYNSTMSSKMSVLGPRHGSILNIDAREYNALVNAYGVATNEDIRYNFNSQDYAAENSWHYDSITDTSGYTYDVMTNGGQYSYSYKNEHYIALNGSVMFINDPTVKALMADDKWTVSFDVSVTETRGAPMFALYSGDSPASSIDWIRVLDNGEVYLYKNGGYVKVGTTQILTGVEYSMTITYNGNTITFYKDGVQFCSDAIGDIQYDNTKGTSPVAFGWTDTIGTSGIRGVYANVRFRNKALSSSQISGETTIGSELLYRYNEGTETIDGRINATNTGNGINTTMSGSIGASYTIAGWVNVGVSRDDGTIFQLGWGGTDSTRNDKQYLSLHENGRVFYCWNDGSAAHYYDSDSVYTFAPNTWYYVQINIVAQDQSCHFKTFVDGTMVNDQTTGYNNMYGLPYNVQSFMMQDTIDVKLGVGNAWWTAKTNSAIDDFRVYTKALDPAVLYQKQKQEDRAEAAGQSGAETGATLDEAMGIYESRIARMASNGYSVMYTNLSAAYEAYKKAVKAKGTGSLAETEALAELNEALTNMVPFVEYTGTKNPSGENFSVSNTATETYFRNVVYSEGATDGAHAFGDYSHRVMEESYGVFWTYGTHAYIYYPQAVLLYDGKNTPVLPVVAGFKNSDNRYSLNMLNVYEEMDDFGLIQSWWYGFNGETSLKWPTANDPIIPTDPNNTSENQYAETPESNDGNYKIVKNGLEYTATPTAAYTCYSTSTWGMTGQYTYLSGDHQVNGAITNAVPDIDIINYKKLIDALSAAANNSKNKGYLADLQEKYQNGGLEGIFGAYDSATSLDPMTGSTYFNHTYDYAATGVEEAMDKAALLCGDDIDASVVLLSDIKITTETANYNRLCAAITAYEEKMAAMTKVHTNLEPAYEAYVLALEYKDAYEFGGRESFENPTLAKAAQNLEEATERMKAFDEVTWDGKAYYGGNDSPNGYSNVVYSDSTANVWSATINQSYTNWKLTTSRNTVLVYNGDASKVYYPAILSTVREASHVNRLAGASTSNSLFTLKEVWRGYLSGAEGESTYRFLEPTDDNYDNNSDYGGSRTNSEHTVNYVTGDYNTLVNGKHPNTTNRYWYNRLYYTGSGDTTNYYEKTTSVSFGVSGVHEMVWDREGTNNNGSFSTNTYVINYKPLYDKIAAIQFSGIDVTQYREAGTKGTDNDFKAWLKKIDSVASIDPNQYDAVTHPKGYAYSSNPETAVQACANDIKTAMGVTISPTVPAPSIVNTKGDIYNAQTGELNPISENNGAYTNLKIALLESRQATEQGCIINKAWNDFQTAIANAKAGMADIADANSSNYTDKQGYNSTAYSAAAINNLATTLDAAYHALTDPSNTAHPLKYSYKEVGTHDMYFQCNNNNSHLVHHPEDEEPETVVPTDGSAYDTLAIIYNTLDKTKYNNFNTIAAGKVTFDAVKTGVFPTTPIDASEYDSKAEAEEAQAQEIVDNGTRTLLEAINKANAAEGIEENPSIPTKYNVTFKVYEIDNTGAVISTLKDETTEEDYGTIQNFDVSSFTGETKEVQYWSVGGKRVNNHDNTITVNSQKDITVEAFIMAKATDIKLIIRSTSDKEFYNINVTADTTIAIKDGDVNTIVLNGTDERRVPDSLTYSITGWHVAFKPEVVTSFAEGTTIGSLIGSGTELVLKPEKSWKYSSKDTLYPFTMDGKPTADGAVPYDYHMRVNANAVNSIDENWTYGGELYGIAFANTDYNIYVPVTYRNTYRFWVNRDMDFYTIVKTDGSTGIDAGYYLPALNISTEEGGYTPFKFTGDEMLLYLDFKLPLMYSYAEPTGEGDDLNVRWTTRSAFTAQVGDGTVGDVTITECGTLYSLNSTYGNVQTMVVENVGEASGNNLYRKVNNNRDADSNQYSYSIRKPGGADQALYTRAYVKYSYTYEGKKIDAIAYGPVNYCAPTPDGN